MNIKKDELLDGYVDSLKLRFDFIDKDLRDVIYSKLIHYVKDTKLVGLIYDDKKSSPFYNSIKLISSNTTIADITKSGYPNHHANISNYYISIGFHGLKRYDNDIDYKSEQLLKNVVAFINTSNMPIPSISQFDICTDVKCNIEHLVAVCVNRKSKKQYYPLGTYDNDGNKIQIYDGTYEVERFTRDGDKDKYITKDELYAEIARRRNNVQKRANLYDKQKKYL